MDKKIPITDMRYSDFFQPEDILFLPITDYHVKDHQTSTLIEFLGNDGELAIVFDDNSMLKIDLATQMGVSIMVANHDIHFGVLFSDIETGAFPSQRDGKIHAQLEAFLKDNSMMVRRLSFMTRKELKELKTAEGKKVKLIDELDAKELSTLQVVWDVDDG